MTIPDAPVPDADVAEQRLSAAADDSRTDGPDLDVDDPEADVLEQSQPVAPGQHRAARDLPLEADDADAAEQAVVVPLDEDEGRE